jgi:magnesium-transporting ATPase (P-type)
VEIVTNTTLALGSNTLNQEGAIVSRLSAIEDMARFFNSKICDFLPSLSV